MNEKLFGGIEAGGTKFVLAVGTSPTEILASQTIPTRGPSETLAESLTWFEQQGSLKSIGIASFGPVELDRNSSQWGHILDTPKEGWSNCDLAGFFSNNLAIPVGFETDVNGAALGEYHFGAGKDSSALTYVTVGTGIGGGTVIDGRLIHGAGHPELGHMYPRRDAADREFAGKCPFHGDCLEGLASGPAVMARWGSTLSQLPQDHEAHELVAGYLAQMCHSVFAAMATQTIVLGGGVMNTPRLLDRVRVRTKALGAGYLPRESDRQIVRPSLGDGSALSGTMLIAEQAHNTTRSKIDDARAH
ncbi:ROK family protein [Paraurantiacibacter namhicola]|uniref:fructokinase n=1 Tax=Paraurantiacibacter namhicola TaxID=645517 RepID=A0A1C7D6H6_9SPHN|nr:ROK family protein [Paraurantiacibacter namhicola]ANU07064.1 Putative fructokinase [Paraurantiacibacter namhicola]